MFPNQAAPAPVLPGLLVDPGTPSHIARLRTEQSAAEAGGEPPSPLAELDMLLLYSHARLPRGLIIEKSAAKASGDPPSPLAELNILLLCSPARLPRGPLMCTRKLVCVLKHVLHDVLYMCEAEATWCRPPA